MTRGIITTVKSFAILFVIVFFLAVLQLKGYAGWLSRVFVVLPKPIVYPIEAVSRGVRQGVSAILSIRGLYVENAELKNRVLSLEQQAANFSALQSENETLKSELGFAAQPPVAIVPCTVAARDPAGITQTLLLSCGSAQGVAVGQGVVVSGYLVGKVVLVSSTTATVRLLTAPTTAVDVRLASRHTSGVLRGSFGSGLLLDYISQTTEIAKGDLVTTAGINGAIPPDILVGSVSDIGKERGALFYKITVSSPVDFRDLRFVHVLKP
jgi:rod shape-determining protein MreC